MTWSFHGEWPWELGFHPAHSLGGGHLLMSLPTCWSGEPLCAGVGLWNTAVTPVPHSLLSCPCPQVIYRHRRAKPHEVISRGMHVTNLQEKSCVLAKAFFPDNIIIFSCRCGFVKGAVWIFSSCLLTLLIIYLCVLSLSWSLGQEECLPLGDWMFQFLPRIHPCEPYTLMGWYEGVGSLGGNEGWIRSWEWDPHSDTSVLVKRCQTC